jgi:PhnB protein
MATVNTYLTFNGNCEEAFNFYKDCFGKEFQRISRMGDMPPQQGFEIKEEDKNKIMHVCLPVSNETMLMGSDSAYHSRDAVTGNNFSISINAENRTEADALFGSLSSGGKVTMPMNNMFWGGYFGMFTDKFGIKWMVSVEEIKN